MLIVKRILVGILMSGLLMGAACTPEQINAYNSLTPEQQSEVVAHLQSEGNSGSHPECNDGNKQNCEIGWEVTQAKGYSSASFSCLDYVVDRESLWENVKNKSGSSAFGIPQALPGSKMASHGSDWRTNPATQVSWMIDYMESRYGGLCEAKAFKQKKGWY